MIAREAWLPSLPVDPDPGWREHAACAAAIEAGEAAADWWFPDMGRPSNGSGAKQARAICASCPVADRCLGYALANNEQWGIWGGLNEKQRRQARRRARSVA